MGTLRSISGFYVLLQVMGYMLILLKKHQWAQLQHPLWCADGGENVCQPSPIKATTSHTILGALILVGDDIHAWESVHSCGLLFMLAHLVAQ